MDGVVLRCEGFSDYRDAWASIQDTQWGVHTLAESGFQKVPRDPEIKIMWMNIRTNHYKLVCVISMYTRILISFYLPIVISYIPVPAGRTVIQDAVWQKCQAKELCCSEAKKLAQQCLDLLQRMVEEWRAAQKVQNQQPTEARAGECIHWGLERNLGCLRPRHHESCPLAAAAKNCFRKSSFSCGVKVRYVVEYLPGCKV